MQWSLTFLNSWQNKILIKEIKESSVGYVTNKTKIVEIFQSWNAVLNSDRIRTHQEMIICLIYSSLYLKSISATDKQKYETEGSEENKIWNYNRVLLRLDSAIQRFMDQRSDNWFLNGERRLTNKDNPNKRVRPSKELSTRYVGNDEYALQCSNKWINN